MFWHLFKKNSLKNIWSVLEENEKLVLIPQWSEKNMCLKYVMADKKTTETFSLYSPWNMQ